MAIELSVKIKSEISVSQLRRKIKIIAKSILGCDLIPDVIVSEVIFEKKGKIVEEKMGNKAKLFSINFMGYDKEQIWLTIFEVPSVKGYEDEGEEGWWGVVSLRHIDSDITKNSLFFSTIISLAELNDVVIIDDSSTIIKEGSITVDNLLSAIKLNSIFNSFENSLKQFDLSYKLKKTNL